jgi:hypothetical protein
MNSVFEIIIGFAIVFTFGILGIKGMLLFINFYDNNNINRKYIKVTDIITNAVKILINIFVTILLLLIIYAVEDMGKQVDVTKIPNIFVLCITFVSLTIALMWSHLLINLFSLIGIIINYIEQRRKTIFNSLIENISNGDSRLAVDNYKIIRQSNKELHLGQSEWIKLLSILVIEKEEQEAEFLAKKIVKNKVIKQKERFNKNKRPTH